MATITQEAEIAAAVTIPGETLHGIIAKLFRAEDRLAFELDRWDTKGYAELGEAICDLYQAAFGEMFVDNDESAPEFPDPDCYAPLYRLAMERAAA